MQIKSFVTLLIATLIISGCDRQLSNNSFKYIPAQIEEGDNWSIIDQNGEIIVKNEYSEDSKLSPISDNGTYWVLSDEKYQLFNVKSPKRPISKMEYGQALRFINQSAFVCDGINPIQLIDENGEIIQTLSKDIREVSLPDEIIKTLSMIRFRDKTGKYGYLDAKGNIAIPAKYVYAHHFSDGLALVRRDSTTQDFEIIDTQGNVHGKIDTQKYKLDYDLSFCEGKIAVVENNQDGALVYLDRNGEIVLQPKKHYKKIIKYQNYLGSSFKDGLAIVADENGNKGVIDDTGDCLIRPGKYNDMLYLGNELFAVEEDDNGSWKMVDKNDEAISEEEHATFSAYKLGENYIVYENNYFYLVAPTGEELKNVEFENLNWDVTNEIHYTDCEQIATILTEKIDATGYAPFKTATNAREIASILNVKPDEAHRYKKFIYHRLSYIDALYPLEILIDFDQYPQVEKTHTEMVNDGWFSYQKTVSDGWDWNRLAQLETISIYVHYLPFYKDRTFEKTLRKEIEKALKKKGFYKLGEAHSYEATNGKYRTIVSLNFEEKKLELSIKRHIGTTS